MASVAVTRMHDNSPENIQNTAYQAILSKYAFYSWLRTTDSFILTAFEEMTAS